MVLALRQSCMFSYISVLKNLFHYIGRGSSAVQQRVQQQRAVQQHITQRSYMGRTINRGSKHKI